MKQVAGAVAGVGWWALVMWAFGADLMARGPEMGGFVLIGSLWGLFGAWAARPDRD